jgi:hypothetical protein
MVRMTGSPSVRSPQIRAIRLAIATSLVPTTTSAFLTLLWKQTRIATPTCGVVLGDFMAAVSDDLPFACAGGGQYFST